MNYKLIVPNLDTKDRMYLSMVSIYMGYTLLIDDLRRSYLVKSSEDVAFIQKSDKHGVFLVWKSTEKIVFLHDLVELVNTLESTDLLPDGKPFKKSFIKGVRALLRWTPGKTLAEECQKILK
jgi:hypothetical protein